MKVRQWISDITNDTKQYSMDSFISPKFIYSETQSIIADFLKKDNDAKRKLAKLSEGWSELSCVKMREVSVTECPDIDFRVCKKLYKSVNKLPDTYSYSYGNIIKHVSSVNFEVFFDPVTPRQFSAIQKREFVNPNKKYYFISSGYLYIPLNTLEIFGTEEVRVEAYFKNQKDVTLFNAECSDCLVQPDICKSILDYDLVIPFYLENDVKKELLNRLANLYLKVNADPYPNLNPISISGTQDKQVQKTL